MQSLSYGPIKGFWVVAGVGTGSTPLGAFDAALLAAGVGNYNLVRMSSILPPGTQEVNGCALPEGSLIPVAYGSTVQATRGERVTAAIAVAVPENPARIGVIMEYAGELSEEEARALVRAMAEEAMARRGIPVKIVRVRSASARVEDRPTAAFAGVVLVPEQE